MHWVRAAEGAAEGAGGRRDRRRQALWVRRRSIGWGWGVQRRLLRGVSSVPWWIAVDDFVCVEKNGTQRFKIRGGESESSLFHSFFCLHTQGSQDGSRVRLQSIVRSRRAKMFALFIRRII